MVGEEDVLEERGASGGDPAVAVIPGGWRAGWAESVRQPVSLGGAGTGGTVASGVDFKKHERNKCDKKTLMLLGPLCCSKGPLPLLQSCRQKAHS